MNGCRILRCSMCSSSFSGFFVSSLCPCCCSLITFRGSQERGIRLRDWRLDCALLCLSLTCICLLSQALAPGSTLEFLSSSDFVCWWQLAGPLLGSFGRWLSCLAVALLPSFVLAAPMMLCRICFLGEPDLWPNMDGSDTNLCPAAGDIKSRLCSCSPLLPFNILIFSEPKHTHDFYYHLWSILCHQIWFSLCRFLLLAFDLLSTIFSPIPIFLSSLVPFFFSLTLISRAIKPCWDFF